MNESQPPIGHAPAAPTPAPPAPRRARDGRHGVDGDDGESAYQIARRRGFVGTEDSFLASLRGRDGGEGLPGRDGTDGKDGRDGKDGADGRDGKDGVRGERGLRGARGLSGKAGERGAPGQNGWTPVLALVEDGERVVQQVTRWVGGTGDEPERGLYVGPEGFTERIDEATNLRGPAGRARDVLVGGGGGLSQAQVIALIEGLVMEDFDEVIPEEGSEQTAGGVAGVLTFTFTADVHKVWVKLLATSLSDTSSGRVRTTAVDPDADTGLPIEAGVPQPIAAVTSEVRVYTPAGKTVNVTGYRRRA